MKKVDPEAEKKRLEKMEAERKLREKMEAERIRREQEEIERKRIEAEQRRQDEIKTVPVMRWLLPKLPEPPQQEKGIQEGVAIRGSHWLSRFKGKRRGKRSWNQG